jgi:hypothetical protein
MDQDEKLLCPSHKCMSGARLIGIVQENGSVAFLGQALPIDRRFVQIATQGRPPELRFRFANTCAEGVCANWAGDSCGIAAQISPTGTATGGPPNCGIRTQCQWYRQRGATACVACPEIVRGSEEVR